MYWAMILGWMWCGASWASEPVPLNTATVEQLSAIEGVDPTTANQVVAMRTKRGSLASVEALRAIPGMTDATLDALRKGTEWTVSIPVSTTRTYDSVEAVLAEFSDEPSVQQVQSWASDYAKTNPVMVERWLRSSRTFATLPELTLEYKMKDGWDQGFDYKAADGTELSLASQEPVALLNDAGTDQDVEYKVRARWELDKIMLSSERIRVLSEAQDIAKLRDNVLTDVTELYFERRRLQAELLLNPSSDLSTRVRDRLKLMELSARIDAFTGGAFSAAL